MGTPRGLSDEGRHQIEALARDHLARGWHTGAQLAIYRDGVLSLDARLGEAEGDARLLWFSATKPLTAVAALALVERGVLDLDWPIAVLWPEFAKGGKTGCTVRHVLTHRGGFPVFPPDFDWWRIDDWFAVTSATAAIEAEWEPGSAVGYHPVTYGFALGEVIRHIDGRDPRVFMAQELFRPLRMEASLGLGLGVDREVHFTSPQAMSEVTFEDPEGTEGRTSDIVRRFTLSSTLRGQVPAANAIGTAEALARFYAMLERGGTLDQVRILSPALVEQATTEQVSAELDHVTGLPSSYGLGFITGGVFAPFDRPGVFGHSGQQCTIAYADPARGLAVAYVTNGLHDPLVVQQRTEEMVEAIEAACA